MAYGRLDNLGSLVRAVYRPHLVEAVSDASEPAFVTAGVSQQRLVDRRERNRIVERKLDFSVDVSHPHGLGPLLENPRDRIEDGPLTPPYESRPRTAVGVSR
jgi:hypothetical protein